MADDADRSAAADVSADDPTSSAEGDGADSDGSESSGEQSGRDDQADAPVGRSEVVVPMSLYKVVTVFSTLFAVALVVGGMIALDVATGRATFDADEIRLPIAFLGVAAIVLGAAIYAFAARFRAEGMGNPKDRDDQR